VSPDKARKRRPQLAHCYPEQLNWSYAANTTFRKQLYGLQQVNLPDDTLQKNYFISWINNRL
jgi:hypothetical protein